MPVAAPARLSYLTLLTEPLQRHKASPVRQERPLGICTNSIGRAVRRCTVYATEQGGSETQSRVARSGIGPPAITSARCVADTAWTDVLFGAHDPWHLTVMLLDVKSRRFIVLAVTDND
jgi:hypothetical protein